MRCLGFDAFVIRCILIVEMCGGDKMALFDEEPPKRKLAHELGQDLSLLSVGDLDERISMLKQEIVRLESDRVGKSASRSAAEALFR
jgi:uncharacterized small protein (DUF1192 family)